MACAKTKIALLACLVFLGGCTFASLKDWALSGGAPPRKVFEITPARENWCYRTIGKIECYPQPQDFPPESLVSVDPPSKWPLTREDYAKALAAARAVPEAETKAREEKQAEPPAPQTLLSPEKKP